MIIKEGKLFGKINVIDLAVVIVILLAAAGFALRTMGKSPVRPLAAGTEDIQIEFYQEEAPEFAARAVKIGSPAREARQNADFGRVADIKIDKSVSWVDSDKGAYVKSTKPGYCSVRITMDAKGSFGATGVTIDNSVYYVGNTINLYAGNAVFYGWISDIRRKGSP